MPWHIRLLPGASAAPTFHHLFVAGTTYPCVHHSHPHAAAQLARGSLSGIAIVRAACGCQPPQTRATADDPTCVPCA
ncbi:MAG: hypothetical protein J3K34DRAFT_427886, partial [Monoraphidium minutum]